MRLGGWVLADFTCIEQPSERQLFTCESIEKLYFFNVTSGKCQRFWGCDRRFFGSLAECFVDCEDAAPTKFPITAVPPAAASVFSPRTRTTIPPSSSTTLRTTVWNSAKYAEINKRYEAAAANRLPEAAMIEASF
ncbi:unnamed protein product, partial [Mesorhabditis spiculigera]